MSKYQRLALLLAVAYLMSAPVFAFGHVPQDGTTGALKFFTIHESDSEIVAHSSKEIDSLEKAQTEIAVKSKTAASGIISICILTSIFFLVLNIVKLTKSADNPNERRTAITGILISSVVFIGFGGYGVVTGILLNLFV